MPAAKKMTFEHWKADAFTANLTIIKTLRKTYSNYPYLYEYDEKEETEYLNAYLQAGNDLDVFVCRIDGEVVGISIGCRLITHIPICQGLEKKNINTNNAYYFGDIIIEKKAWGNGIADKLYTRHIAYVKSQGYENIFALLVERRADDPRKPPQYHPSQLWAKHGFRATDQHTQFTWNTRGTTGKFTSRQIHLLRIYEKRLHQR